MPHVTLVTYTYNDGHLADGLLASIRTWNARPDSVLVLDDGSETPYAAPRDLGMEVRTLRLDRNSGIPTAKATGLSAAGGDILLSVDCDVRPASDWLVLCLPHILRPEVGLAGGAVLHAAGSGLVSRYLRRFGDNHNLGATGPVEFIPGNAFLIRRAVWEEVGGFGDFRAPVCEDHELCRRLRQRGYTLFSDSRARASQVRRLSRRTMCKRIWMWCHTPVKDGLGRLGRGAAPAYVHEVLVRPMLARMDVASSEGELLFFYLEILYLAHVVLDLLAWAENNDHAAPGGKTSFRCELHRSLAPWPALDRLLAADLARLGHGPRPATTGSTSDWADLLAFIPGLGDSGLLAWLQASGMEQLLAEEDQATDFSSYDACTVET